MLKTLNRLLQKVNFSATNHIDNTHGQYIVFGIFGVLNYPLLYLIWHHYNGYPYGNFYLYGIATFLCILLIFKNNWPTACKHYLPLYWYITLGFCLPFFYTFMALQNQFSAVWLMATDTILFWLLLFVQWRAYLIILFNGALLGVISYILINPSPFSFVHLLQHHYVVFSTQLTVSFVFIVLFAYKNTRYNQEKIQAAKTISSSIAHELRTPLLTIQSAILSTQDLLPKFINQCKPSLQTETIDLEVDFLSWQFDKLNQSLTNAEHEIHCANEMIRMLLVNLSMSPQYKKKSSCHSIIHCVQQAIQRYPFKNEQHRRLIHWEVNISDFSFRGELLLMVHVILNLLKNAFYHIDAAQKGSISIRTTLGRKNNILHIKDTSTGIPRKHLPHIFQQFYSQTPLGAGIGLTFCQFVIQNFGGSIRCQSKEGDFTEFSLYFPNVDNQ